MVLKIRSYFVVSIDVYYQIFYLIVQKLSLNNDHLKAVIKAELYKIIQNIAKELKVNHFTLQVQKPNGFNQFRVSSQKTKLFLHPSNVCNFYKYYTITLKFIFGPLHSTCCSVRCKKMPTPDFWYSRLTTCPVRTHKSTIFSYFLYLV